MKFLVIGLGSMGKRRIRNLKALKVEGIFGFDPKAERRDEVESKYGIPVFSDFREATQQTRFDAFIISVPPDKHHIYMTDAINMRMPFFVEASVVDDQMDVIIKQARELELLAAPSSTMIFHPAIIKIRETVEQKIIGEITNIVYHSGQYLPEWHTYEHVRDFYVSKKATGGAREIVPFELTWLVKIFGFPNQATGFYKKTIFIEGAEEIDDTYCGLYDYGNFILNLTVDVVSRSATRRLLINGSEGQLLWDWNDDFVQIYTPCDGWKKHIFKLIEAASGYNKNITEQMYIDEMNCFLNALYGKGEFVNTLESDYKVLKLLYALEQSQDTGRIIRTK